MKQIPATANNGFGRDACVYELVHVADASSTVAERAGLACVDEGSVALWYRR